MHRLPWLDRLLLLVIVPVWLLALALHVRQVWKGELAHVAFYVTAPTVPTEYPTVAAFWPGERAIATRFAVGDRIVSLNGVDLAGEGPYRFFARALAELAKSRRRDPHGTVMVQYLRGSEIRTAELPWVAAQFPWRMLPLTATFAITGVLVLLRRPATRLGRAFFLGSTLFSLHWTWFFGGAPRATYVWYAVFFCASGLMLPFMLRAASLFPEEVAPKGRMPRWPWIFVGYAPIVLTGSVGAPLPPRLGLPGIWLVNVLFIIALLSVLTRNYFRAGAEGRRQLRWGIFGMYVGLVPLLLASGVLLVKPGWWWLLDVTATAEVVIPISILIAIVRANLYDIDRLITSAIAYTILSILLLGGVLIVAPRFADVASRLIGLDRTIGVPLFSGILAVALVACQRFLAPIIERLLFQERYSLNRGMQGLLMELQDAPDARRLLEVVGDRLNKLFHPEHCTVYVLRNDQYVPTFTAHTKGGSDSPQTIAAEHPLVVLAADTGGPIDVEDWMRRRRGRSIAPAVRTALEAARASVVFPIVEGDGVPALMLLGAKWSGDAYAPGDLALLTAVAEAVSTNLARVERQRRTAAGPLLLPRKYEMLGEIGRGGMGCVYRVKHATLGTVQAMKILPEHLAGDETLVARFRREARVMADLRHRNIVRVFDFDQEGSHYYFVMECIDGVSLSQLLHERGALPLDEVLRIALQVADGLNFAHRHEPAVIHRDIKPANILIEHGSGRAVVTDFGIAKILEPQESFRTQTGDVFGTLKYCAPEQLRGESDVDARADVYSLGMVIYEVALGRQLFAGMDEAQVLAAALQDTAEYRIPPELPEPLRPLVLRALAKDRTQRYPDVGALLDDLRTVARGIGIDLPLVMPEASASESAISSSSRRTEAGPAEAPTADSSLAPTRADSDPTTTSQTMTGSGTAPLESPWPILGAIALTAFGLLAMAILGWFFLARPRGW